MNRTAIDKLRRAIERDKLDALLVSKPNNVSYLSDFNGEGQLLITATKQFLITDFRYQEDAAKSKKSFELWAREGFSPLEENIVSLAKKLKLRGLGFESYNTPYAFYRRLKKALGKKHLIPTSNIIEKIRAVKSPKEIRIIRKAASCAVASFSFAKNFVKPGKTEEEIAQGIQYFMKKIGAEDKAFDIIVASGKRASLPHAYASKKCIKKNDAVLIDLGCRKCGYNSDLTRVVFLGKMWGKIKRIYDIVLRAQQLAIEAVRAGEQIRTIDKIARQHIANEGFSPFFGHALGHGIGREVHEYPSISPRNQDRLEAGMVITIEPGIYIPGWGGIRIEDMVLVKKDGSEILTE
ncbi:MAG: aminopeptidase P family protein [Candidatus Omnitrophica bacterium]|nr:aminopeptidase P family protein [Candidatus Omnitrophota bacterium]